MPKRPFLSAALATSVAISQGGANAATGLPSASDSESDVIATAPDFTNMDDTIIYGNDFLDEPSGVIDALPEEVDASDTDIEIHLAQTVFGGYGGDVVGNRAVVGKPSRTVPLTDGVKTPRKLSPDLKKRTLGQAKPGAVKRGGGSKDTERRRKGN